MTNHSLLNTLDTNFRAISDAWPVFAFSVDLGTVTTNSNPAVFAIGHLREQIGQVNGVRYPYFASQYAVDDVVSLHLIPSVVLLNEFAYSRRS